MSQKFPWLHSIHRAARVLATVPTQVKRDILIRLAYSLEHERAKILAANQQDLATYAHLPAPFLERLTLNEKRVQSMVDTVRHIASDVDPVGQEIRKTHRPSGIELTEIRWPMGTVMVIFESRPNIITEVFALGFYSGNALILKGGKESARTAEVIYTLITNCLRDVFPNDLPFFADHLMPRDDLADLLRHKNDIQLLIPRGGDALMRFCDEHSRIPMLKNDRGLCHLYVHDDADIEMAVKVITNAKVSRPSVCNSLETILVHEDVASIVLPKLLASMKAWQVQWHVCPQAYQILSPIGGVDIHAAQPDSFDTEYLDFAVSCKVVPGFAHAVSHIEKHSSRHSDGIITRDAKAAHQFFLQVNSAAVYWNASTRFTDGGEFGLGGEIGISTERVFHRGPLGLVQLTTPRYWIRGDGSVRG